MTSTAMARALPGPAGARPPIDIRVEEHIGLIRHVISRHGFYRRAWGAIDYDDLVSVGVMGVMGLMRARETWDPALGTWGTYSVYWIAQHVRREIENRGCAVRRGRP